jgi:hypothetical protein
MKNNRLTNYISNLLPNIPDAWLSLTTHRLDIYQEALAKTEFLDQFNTLYEAAKYTELDRLPTAYDYIRLGHPLSCVLEWAIAKSSALNPEDVICFSSQTIAIMAILRKKSPRTNQYKDCTYRPLAKLLRYRKSAPYLWVSIRNIVRRKYRTDYKL